MRTREQNLSILFFPFLAHGHMLPMVDMAKLFAGRGAAVTVLTTPVNAALIRPTIDRFNSSALSPICLHLIPFPSAAANLPEGCENLSSISVRTQLPNFKKAIDLLRQPFEHVLKDLRPDCVVSDSFFPWTYDVAAEKGIPRIIFDGTNFFATCAADCIRREKLLEKIPPEAEFFILPGLPHQIALLRSQLLDPSKLPPSMTHIAETIKEANEVAPKSYGLLVNSFYELESDYVEHYRKGLGKKAWHVGPVADKSGREGGDEEGDRCLKWLDERKPGSVVYMCFGSICDFTKAQLREMAVGLEASGHPFVWAVRNAGEDWVPEGYEERLNERGFVIRGWAPQLSILDHAAVGGFITHCGWNSSLEGITAGLPMGTWPLNAEQFLNERFLVDVLKIGVEVGSKVFGFLPEDRPVVEGEALEAAVRTMMGEGEEAENRRRRARELQEMGWRAVQEGGSSYNDLGNLLQELMERKAEALLLPISQ